MSERNTGYQFVSTDTEAVESLLISIYEKITGVSVKPASPEKLFIQFVAAVVIQERGLNNYTGNQNIPSPMQPCRSIWLMGIRSQSLAPAVPRTRRKPSAAMMPQACRNLFRVMLVTSRCIRGRRCDLRSAPIHGRSLHCGRKKPRRRQGSCLHTERR